MSEYDNTSLSSCLACVELNLLQAKSTPISFNDTVVILLCVLTLETADVSLFFKSEKAPTCPQLEK